MTVRVLAHGQFFGRFQTEAEAGGFTLAQMHADPQNDVQRHMHDAGHFIFVTRGPYITTAAGAPEVCTSPVLVYNPPGTTHRDRFLRRKDGGFDGTSSPSRSRRSAGRASPARCRSPSRR